jgi:hypothetical protein
LFESLSRNVSPENGRKAIRRLFSRGVLYFLDVKMARKCHNIHISYIVLVANFLVPIICRHILRGKDGSGSRS